MSDSMLINRRPFNGDSKLDYMSNPYGVFLNSHYQINPFTYNAC